jgi:hypothetical protein
MSEHEVELTKVELTDLAAAYGWWKAHGDPEAFNDTLNAAIAARLADAEARAEAAKAKVARVEALADELAHPDTDLIVAYERAVHRNIARDIREALRGDQ